MNDQNVEGLSSGELLRMTSDVVAAYVKNNPLQAAELTSVIQTVHSSLSVLNGGGEAKAEPQKPAVSIRRSVTPDYIVCLEDGKKLKMLKRHLRTTYGLTPDEYRAKWGLPTDYPMVAPNYAKQRSAFAKKIGLGHSTKRRTKKR
ncbi:MAG: MucR family transcriptional regulator [Rhodospirillales bacterium]|nr:MucR family transcriptional regulator [Rhodospirillales bacterium]MDH3917135.1 MucR family transcriptional regulator [Rhodospirillales bacterium]MDH3966230.1 MucR family transcriptional regulator [Rhodospirillales bacterium]